MINVMIDLETLAFTPDATVLQVALVSFDNQYNILDEYCSNVKPHVQNRVEDKETIEWWSNQDKDVRKSVLVDPKDPEIVAEEILQFFRQYKNIRLWCNHIMFDIRILESFLKQFSDFKAISEITSYNKVEDFATLRNAVTGKLGWGFYDEYCKESYAGKFLEHNALDDCKYQIHVLSVIDQEVLNFE